MLTGLRWVVAASVAGGFAGGFFAGCAHDGGTGRDGATRDIDDAGVFDFPQLALDSSGRERVVVGQLPNPGYRMTLDGVEQGEGASRVFVSVVSPDPEFMYAQIITETRVGSTVPSGRSVELFARRTDHKGVPTGPYRRVP